MKVDELQKDINMRRFQVKMEDRTSRKRKEEWGGIEEEWEDLREIIKVCAEDVCGWKRIGGMIVLRGM